MARMARAMRRARTQRYWEEAGSFSRRARKGEVCGVSGASLRETEFWSGRRVGVDDVDVCASGWDGDVP